MVITLTLLVALVGLVVFILAANTKVQELGRILFFCGVLAFLLNGVQHVVELFPRH